MFPRLAFAAALLVGLFAVSFAGETAAPVDDDGATMFEGMHRDAVAVLLGPPHRVKRSHGQETLVYSLRRVGDDYVPSDRERLLVVPGQGRCVALLGNDGGTDDRVTIEPVRTDDRGRPISGGPTSTLSRTVTLGEDERLDEPPPNRGRLGRKLKLKLVLAGDRVQSWSATP